MTPPVSTEHLLKVIEGFSNRRNTGKLVSVRGLLNASINSSVGELCYVIPPNGRPSLAEVVGFSDGLSQLMALDGAASLTAGATVVGLKRRFRVPVGRQLLGRILNGLCQPIDDSRPLVAENQVPLLASAPDPMSRKPINSMLETGQRAIDSMLTIGVGQRIGLFAGSGVGKSTLLGEIARKASSDVNVVVLVGERGREVRPFIEDVLGKEGLKRSVVIVSTAEQPALIRIRSAQVAVTIADWFRKQGKNVLLMIDSLTRLAWSQRELGLSLGEAPSSRGFPPSAIHLMARLIEQLGNSDRGTITGIMTVLVDGDDTDEPVADAARSFLDGHIVLSRKLAEKGHFPAIDINASISRVAQDITSMEHQQAALAIRKVLSEYSELEDIIRIGAYQPGSSAQVDKVIRLEPVINQFLKQSTNEFSPFPQSWQGLQNIARMIATPLPQQPVHPGTGVSS